MNNVIFLLCEILTRAAKGLGYFGLGLRPPNKKRTQIVIIRLPLSTTSAMLSRGVSGRLLRSQRSFHSSAVASRIASTNPVKAQEVPVR